MQPHTIPRNDWMVYYAKKQIPPWDHDITETHITFHSASRTEQIYSFYISNLTVDSHTTTKNIQHRPWFVCWHNVTVFKTSKSHTFVFWIIERCSLSPKNIEEYLSIRLQMTLFIYIKHHIVSTYCDHIHSHHAKFVNNSKRECVNRISLGHEYNKVQFGK